ncbi:unnamed protein product [Angiostrongylus costaricensis]|uniref:Uncharacterized protein n=1 Tax=Angiostrongylus costaricensis TaxID=334426 RepID=A0A0R3PII0_ANGCS|nr:unnamed protein product [Angiostrongylus costaricensis]
MKAESSKVTKRHWFPETLELKRQRGIERGAGNREQTSELGKHCRPAIKEDLKKRRVAVMIEAAEAGKSIRKAHRSFANYKTKMIALRRPEIRRAISLVKNRTAPGPDRMRPEHPKNLPPVLVNTLVGLSTRCLPECKSLLITRPARPCYCSRKLKFTITASIAQTACCVSSTNFSFESS